MRNHYFYDICRLIVELCHYYILRLTNKIIEIWWTVIQEKAHLIFVVNYKAGNAHLFQGVAVKEKETANG